MSIRRGLLSSVYNVRAQCVSSQALGMYQSRFRPRIMILNSTFSDLLSQVFSPCPVMPWTSRFVSFVQSCRVLTLHLALCGPFLLDFRMRPYQFGRWTDPLSSTSRTLRLLAQIWKGTALSFRKPFPACSYSTKNVFSLVSSCSSFDAFFSLSPLFGGSRALQSSTFVM